jgi:hypothetical protein
MIALHNALEWGKLGRCLRLLLTSLACIIVMFFISLQPSLAAGDAVATGTRRKIHRIKEKEFQSSIEDYGNIEDSSHTIL